MNKLFILKLNKKIVAISESKSDMEIFVLQCNLINQKIEILKEKDNKKINKYLNQYSDVYLHEYEGFILPDKDISVIDRLVQEHRNFVKDTIKSLKLINSNYIMSIDDHDIIKKCIEVIKRNKKDNFDEFINLNEIIMDYNNISGIRELFEGYHNIF